MSYIEQRIRSTPGVLTLIAALACLLFFIQPAIAQSDCGATITVQAGDHLSRIARRCNTSVAALLDANPAIVNPNLIYVGQVLNVPGADGQGERSLRVAPDVGLPNATVQLTASGFAADSDVEIGFGPVDSEYEIIAQGRTDSSGGLQQEVTVPGFAAAGGDYVFVIVPAGAADATISNTFSVTQADGGDAPSVGISPRSGPPGSSVQIQAGGFPPLTRVSYGIGLADSETFAIRSARTTRDGSLQATVRTPQTGGAGTELVVVVYVPQRDGARAISDRFTMTSATGDGGYLFTRTNIYLIALEDGGRSGQEIGCGDSVVPVEVEIVPTVAPLTAALEALFAIEDRLFGASGLYHSLHNSNLSIDSIAVENGVATINLDGELSIGGVCDAPRVQAQIEETALQYATVDEVQVFLNGEALPSVLSGQ